MINFSKNIVPPFIEKLWDLLEDSTMNEILVWTSSGESFEIRNQEKFTEILPYHFKHSKYLSFVRQLNMYNFKKVRGASYDEFYHSLFRRGARPLLIGIKRKPSQQENQFGNELIRKFSGLLTSEPNENIKKEEKEEYFHPEILTQNSNKNEEIKGNLQQILFENSRLRQQNMILWNECKKSKEKIARDNQKLFKYFTAIYSQEYHTAYSKQLRQAMKNHPFFIHLSSDQSPLTPQEYLMMQNYSYPQYYTSQLTVIPPSNHMNYTMFSRK